MRSGWLRHKVTIKSPVETTDVMGSASDHWVDTAAGAWAANTAKALSDDVVPTTANSFYYTCTTAGTTHAATEPTWPTTLASTVADNTVVWTCTGFDVFASVSPLKSTEVIQQDQLDNIITHRVRIRYRSDVTSKMRIYFGTRVFRVEGIYNWEEKNVYLECRCSEVD